MAGETNGSGGRPVLVLGGSGMLGTALRAELERRGRPFEAPDRHALDLTDREAIDEVVRAGSWASVINAAAYTDVGRAELDEEQETVVALNRDLPRRLARACGARGIRLLHVSTDYVFDGRKGAPYLEGDPVAPLQAYGRTKLEGERAALGVNPRTLVARTSTLYGPGRRARPHYVDAILRQTRDSRRLQVVRLPIASPTYAPDLADWLLALEPLSASGIVHTVNDGGCSRFELASAAVRLAGVADRVEVAERPEPAGSLARPEDSTLDVARLGELLGRRPRPWLDALGEYVRERWSG